MNTFGSSKERERDAAVALLGPIEAMHNADAALKTADMDDVESSPAYEDLRLDADDAYRNVNITHSKLYENGFTQTEVIRGTGKAIDIVNAFKESTPRN